MNEQKNLLLAIVASLLILMIFQYLFPNKSDTQNLEYSNFNVESETDNNINKILSREEILSKDNRFFISEESRLKGSISLIGARFTI